MVPPQPLQKLLLYAESWLIPLVQVLGSRVQLVMQHLNHHLATFGQGPSLWSWVWVMWAPLGKQRPWLYWPQVSSEAGILGET